LSFEKLTTRRSYSALGSLFGHRACHWGGETRGDSLLPIRDMSGARSRVRSWMTETSQPEALHAWMKETSGCFEGRSVLQTHDVDINK
jgi:hypothetical protein